MVSQGDISGASRLATTPGVLKPSAAGSQIKHLGSGSEGLATMVAHPEHGVAVRKLFDPRGISGPEMIARKEQAGRALGDNPNFAKFYGSAQTPHGGATMHFNEFIPQGQAPTGQAGAQSIKHTTTQAQRALNQAGFAGKDIRQGNMIFDKNTGTHKVIDYIPGQKGEFMRMPQRYSNVIAQSPGSTSSPWNANYSPSPQSSQGGMLGRLLGGRSTPGGMRAPSGGFAQGTSPTSVSSPMATDRTMAAGGLGTAKTQPAQPRPSAGLGSAPTMPAQPRPSQGASTSPMKPQAAQTTPLRGPAPSDIKPQPPATTPLKPPATTPLKPPKPVSGPSLSPR